MKRPRKLLFLLVALLLLGVPALPSYAGEGTYTAGTPDTLTLHVAFMYDEPCFASASCPAWETLFKEGSKLLYDSTQKQVRIGKVMFYNNCPNVNAKADVKIYNDTNAANAHRAGLGTAGYRIRLSQTHKTVTTGTGAGDRGQFGLVHEFGHYVFSLGDEYEDKNSNKTADAFCISKTSTVASIMDGGTTVPTKNRRTEFCWSGNHRTGKTEQDAKRTIGGVDYENKDCWTFLAALVKDEYGATLTVPTSNPTSDTSSHVDPTFEYYDCGVRAVTCIDRSGSMSGDAISLAKSGANTFINLTETTDELAVTSYSSSPSTNFALALMSAANKTVAKTAVNGISASGMTNIGGGLQTSLNEITGAGDPVSNEVIVLLSDGQHNTGTHPDNVIPALKARGVTVYTIGLGSVDAALMRRIATQTGGNYIYANTNAEMKGHFQQVFADLRNNGLLERIDGEMGGPGVTAAASQTYSVYVDSYTTAAGYATFLLTWDDPSQEMNLVVKRPNGTTVSPGDAGVEYLYDSANGDKFYRIDSPPTGTWSVTVSYAGTTELNYSMQVHGAASDVVARGSANQDTYTYPDPILVRALVVVGDMVAGVDVSAEVVRPEWPATTIQLFDDGLQVHGDGIANDGIYSNYFNSFSGDGNYTFNIAVHNVSGYTTAEEEDGGTFVSQSVDEFKRKAQVTVVVDGVPDLSGHGYLPITIKGSTSSTGGGFNSQFNGSASGWETHSGTWTVDSNYYSTTGLAGTSASASYAADFTDFDYQVRMRRSGCDTCANRILIRGTPTPLLSSNAWYSYYGFQYDAQGSYSVWKRVGGGSSQSLQSWTSSSAINPGDAWNTLGVVASGSSLFFYINGTLVWSGSDSSLTSGRVGVGMYRSSSSTGDQLLVDWASLSTLGASGLGEPDTVGAEQQALNDLANQDRKGSEDLAP